MRNMKHRYRKGVRPAWFNPANVGEARHRRETAPLPILARHLLAREATQYDPFEVDTVDGWER